MIVRGLRFGMDVSRYVLLRHACEEAADGKTDHRRIVRMSKQIWVGISIGWRRMLGKALGKESSWLILLWRLIQYSSHVFTNNLKMDSQLFALLHGFFSLTPLNALRFPSRLSAVQINNFLLNNLLLNQHFQQFPPSSQYQKRFWKWAITHLEIASRKYNIEEACLIS